MTGGGVTGGGVGSLGLTLGVGLGETEGLGEGEGEGRVLPSSLPVSILLVSVPSPMMNTLPVGG